MIFLLGGFFWFDGSGDKKEFKNQNVKCKIVEPLRGDFIFD
jgi:hypothetical protein